MNRQQNVIVGLLLGAAVGVSLGIMFAPRSGSDTQQLIRQRIEAVLSEGKDAAEMRRLELTERFERLKQSGLPASAQKAMGLEG